jgi:hypothetical protein
VRMKLLRNAQTSFRPNHYFRKKRMKSPGAK